MPTRVGRLSERITIQSRTVANSTLGAPVDTWTEYHRCYAEIVARPGRERYREQRDLSITEQELRVRFDSVTAPLADATGPGEYRVLWPSTSGVPWDLEGAVREDGRRRWLLLRLTRTR